MAEPPDGNNPHMIGSSLRYAVIALTLALTVAAAPATAPQPRILEVDVPQNAHLGRPITATLHTTSDVVAVHGHVLSFNFNLPQTAPGVFSGTTKVPGWAFFFHGNFKVQFVASTATGAQAQAISTVHI
jgi:hypothetical protein